ncbi:MAG: sigma-54-dependent transcriptional regulator [Myxococcaceae bacterium]
MKPRVAVIDDLEQARQMMQRALSRSFLVEPFASVQEALSALSSNPPDAIVSDLKMPGIDGLEGLKRFKEAMPEVPLVMLTAYATVETAVDAMRAGAFDYQRKPFEAEELELVVGRAVEHAQLRRENARLRRELASAFGDHGIVGRSAPMREVTSIIERVAPSDVPILIEGESGTGKDLVARAIHELSPRKAGPFVALNVSAIPEQLAESQLFGHEKGSFSGANAAHRGFFAEANRGTLFLDEIGTLVQPLQPKLLRVLQNGEFIPVGSGRPTSSDVRTVFATNENLKKSVDAGRFREDLYYRIRIMPVRLPPLRERREDIPLLLEHFVRKHAKRLKREPLSFAPEVMRAFGAYPFPGNVRELENAVERSLLLARGETVRVEDLPPEMRQSEAGAAEGEGGRYRQAREVWEKRYLEELLSLAKGSVGEAAELAGLHRSTLYEKLARYGLVNGGEGGHKP